MNRNSIGFTRGRCVERAIRGLTAGPCWCEPCIRAVMLGHLPHVVFQLGFVGRTLNRQKT